METRRRTLAKATLWQMIGLITMLGVGFAATGSVTLGGAMALINAGVGLTLYVVYERIWARVSWGRTAQGEVGAFATSQDRP